MTLGLSCNKQHCQCQWANNKANPLTQLIPLAEKGQTDVEKKKKGQPTGQTFFGGGPYTRVRQLQNFVTCRWKLSVLAQLPLFPQLAWSSPNCGVCKLRRTPCSPSPALATLVYYNHNPHLGVLSEFQR